MKTLLIASQNNAKINEYTHTLKPLIDNGIEIKTLKDLKIDDDPEETGKTFEENSLLKAKYYANLTNLPVISDDGGICIDVLGGEPGVKSKRWLGRDATDEELIAYTVERLHGKKGADRSARMVLTLTYFNPRHNTQLQETASIAGHLAENARENKNWTPGFPFRALFIVDKYSKFYDDLTEEEHSQINHRRVALKRLLPKIEKDLLQ